MILPCLGRSVKRSIKYMLHYKIKLRKKTSIFFKKRLDQYNYICYNHYCSDERAQKEQSTPGWCNGSTSDSGSFGLGSSPSPGAKWRYGQAAKTSPSQGEIKGSIPFSATNEINADAYASAFFGSIISVGVFGLK